MPMVEVRHGAPLHRISIPINSTTAPKSATAPKSGAVLSTSSRASIFHLVWRFFGKIATRYRWPVANVATRTLSRARSSNNEDELAPSTAPVVVFLF